MPAIIIREKIADLNKVVNQSLKIEIPINRPVYGVVTRPLSPSMMVCGYVFTFRNIYLYLMFRLIPAHRPLFLDVTHVNKVH